MIKRFLALILALCALWIGASAEEILVEDGLVLTEDYEIEYGEYYYTPDEVALYLHVFCELPANFITKQEARDLGWDNTKGNLWKVAPDMAIGGDRFGNREGSLPSKKGRQWYECDVNYQGGYRGSDRLLYSTDGLIYFTEDHYNTFDLLYDGWYLDENGDIYGEVWANAAGD